jgi:hypothetical protein
MSTITENPAGSFIQSRLGEIDAMIVDVDSKLAELSKLREPLDLEKRALEKSLEAMNKVLGVVAKTNGQSESVDVDYEVLKATVVGFGRPAKTVEVAEKLGVGARTISRKLRKLVEDGQIAGDKDSGWCGTPADIVAAMQSAPVVSLVQDDSAA